MEIYCKHPSIILRKDLGKYLSLGYKPRYIADNGHVYPAKLVSPKAVGATVTTYKNWSLISPEGESIPMYMLVPCNKCCLCRKKKADEWATRAQCETLSASYPPLFVTLTYEDSYLPADGVEKRAVQLFMKRFRENWYRTHEDRLDLRYFAVGEYGRQFKRPHYHLLLWNVPHQGREDYIALNHIYNMILRSWSIEISEDEFCKLPDYLRFSTLRVKYGKEKMCYYRILGRIEVSPDLGNSGFYCMKYMRKKPVCPDGKNEPFYLSSRNGGLGSRYLDQHYEEFKHNSRILSMPISVTKVDRRTFQEKVASYTVALPRSFKNKLFPPTSTVLGSLLKYVERFYYICDVLSKVPCFQNIEKYYDRANSILHVFSPIVTYIRNNRYYNYEKIPRYPKSDFEINDMLCGYEFLYYILSSYDSEDVTCFLKVLEENDIKKQKRSDFLNSISHPDYDVVFEERIILQNIYAYENKERF